jgi:hypothetical protein
MTSPTRYFMIRVQRPLGRESEAFTGSIERLGTGEKHQFSNEQELLTLLRFWPADASRMEAAGGPIKEGL